MKTTKEHNLICPICGNQYRDKTNAKDRWLFPFTYISNCCGTPLEDIRKIMENVKRLKEKLEE